MLLFVYNHNGYLLKLPFTMCDEGDNGPGLAMTGLITLAANALVYAGYYLKKRRNSKTINRYQKTAYNRYLSNLERSNSFLVESQIFIYRSLNAEMKNLGLVIVEAYYGLADHIYQIEAGMLRYQIPANAQEYTRCQVAPVTKQIQIKVENGQLEIPSDF
jgi:hypothetical protein